MRRLLLFIIILLILYCDRESKEKAYLPKMEFNHKENPNYSHYFPGKLDSGKKNNQGGNTDGTISAEPVPSFPSQPISSQLADQGKSSGFFFMIIKLIANIFIISKFFLKNINIKIISTIILII